LDNEVLATDEEKYGGTSWMNEILGYDLENEVFAEDEEKYVGTEWMNEILGLVWAIGVFDKDEEKVRWDSRMNERRGTEFWMINLAGMESSFIAAAPRPSSRNPGTDQS
jgi:hypothetical protein